MVAAQAFLIQSRTTETHRSGHPLQYHSLMSSVRVIAAVIAKDDKLLVCRRAQHKRHGGLWEFPGGKLEPDEDDETAARRELAEELGIHVERVGEAEIEIADAGSPLLIAFVPVEAWGTPVCHEHSALAWGTPAELALLPLAPSDRRYVEWRLTPQATPP